MKPFAIRLAVASLAAGLFLLPGHEVIAADGTGGPLPAAFDAGGPPGHQAAEGFTVTVDPRMELLAIVQHFSTWAPGGQIKSHTAYKRDIDECFMGFEEHRAVAWMDSLVELGFTHDAPVRLVLHHGVPPELVQRAPYSEYLISRAGGEAVLEGFVDALRDFATTTRFMDFYRRQQALYETHVREVRTLLGETDYVGALQAFFGASRDGYHLILAPLFAGGYGPGIRDGEREELYAVIGPCARKEDRTTFACRRYLESIMLHEWSHSFVNPWVDRSWEAFRPSAHLFEPIRGMMAQQAYPTWRVALYEHIVRAAETNIRATLEEDFEKAAALRVQEGQGFWYVSPIDSLIAHYRAERDHYADFGTFMPVIARRLAELSVAALPERVTAFNGPLSGVFPRAKRIYLVYPTKLDSARVARLRGELEGFAQFLASFQMPSRIVTDREALELDWEEKVAFVYGSPGGNAFLEELSLPIPVTLAPAGLRFGEERYPGPEVVLISCLPSPFNARLPFVVCLANRPEALIGLGERIGSPEEWEADYVLYRGETRLAAGRYEKTAAGWRR